MMSKLLFRLAVSGFAWLGIMWLPAAFGADNLKLNPHLDYRSDSVDGPLITGDDMQGGIASQKLNYVIIYGEGCFNSKRQARRTVDLYQHYRGRVQFVVIDLDGQQSAEQQNLLRKYYTGSIPHVVILDQHGQALYDQAGEVGEESLSRIFDKALQ
jgi:hypothetical protein